VAIPSILSNQIAIDPVDGIFYFRNSNGAIVGSSLSVLQASNTQITTEDSFQVSGNLVVDGNLIVNGAIVTINTESIVVEDKNIELGSGITTNANASGGGITLKGETDKTFNWINGTGSWTSSEDIDLLSGKVYKINGVEVLSANTYGGSAAKWTNSRKITLAGDLTGNVSIDGSADVILTATVATNSVSLGADTTGDYVSSLVAGLGISLSNNSGETATPTVALSASIDDLTDVTLSSPANGDFFRYNGSVWANDAINLSTDTIGDYVDHLAAGTGIIITNNSGEASVPTISLPQSIATDANVVFNQVTSSIVGNVTGNVTGNIAGNVTGNVVGDVTGNVVGNTTGTHTGSVIGAASSALVWADQRKITLDGDVTGEFWLDGSANVTVTTTIVSNAVALGADTTGQYVANLVSGTGITITDNSGEGMTPVIKVADSYTTNMVSNIANSAASVSTYADGVGNTAYSNAVTYINNRTLDDLSGVTLSNAVVNNVLLYNGSIWVNDNLSIDKISDVLTSNVLNGQVLIYDSSSSKWINSIVPESPAGTSSSFTKGDGTSKTFTLFHGLSTANVVVTVTSNITYEVIQTRWSTTNGVGAFSNNHVTVNFTSPPATDEMNITVYGSVQSTAVIITGRLDNLTGDVMINSPTSGDSFFYNGSKWINREASISTDMSDVLISGNATGQFLKYDGNTWINSSIPTINNLDDVGDVTITGNATDQFLKYNGSAWVNSSVPTINTFDDVGDVTITSASSGQFLKWNGSAWVNDAIDLGTDTTGNYVASLVAGAGITLSNNSGEGTTPTVAVDTTVVAPLTGATFTGVINTPNNTGSMIPFYYANEAAFPTASTSHGAIAHSHATGLMYYAHGGAWVEMAKTNSPTLTGTPLAPTATVGTNTTQVATTEFVSTAVANLVDTAPAALNTLNELSQALGDDENFATTTATSIGLKANIASPTFTGTVSGITKTMVGLDNVDNISDANKPVSTATQTALDLKANIASPTFTGTVTLPAGTVAETMLATGPATAGFNSTINAQTASYTLQATDLAKLVTIDSASNTEVTVPNILSVGDRIDILRKNTGEVTFIAGSGVTVNATPGLKLRAQWSGATLVRLEGNTWVVLGDLKA